MLKIFTTQLAGLFQSIAKEEELLEDAARLLSQALIGEGTLFIYGDDEMATVVAEALYGQDRLDQTASLIINDSMAELDAVDRVLLVARKASDERVLHYAQKIYDQHIPFVCIVAEEDATALGTFADIVIDLGVRNGLVPTDTGERIGYPASITALYCYFALSLLMREMLEELE